jgi:methanogenic corrinoid protein MtbC1
MPHQPSYPEFLALVDAEDRAGCSAWALAKLDSGELDIPTLYLGFLAPALNEFKCANDQARFCVWKEHLRSSIIRTVLESCYPRVMAEKKKAWGGKKGPAVLVVCPAEEFHEIGARIVTDFFHLAGFDATFVGANTPRSDILAAIEYLKPLYVAISVSSPYNLVEARRVVAEIRQAGKDGGAAGLKVIVGGNAFSKNPDAAKGLGADMFLAGCDEIIRLPRGPNEPKVPKGPKKPKGG